MTAPAWARFDLLVANLSDGVTVQDASGRLVYANEAGARMSGYPTPTALIEAPVGDYARRFEVLRPDGTPAGLEDLPGRKALRGGTAEATFRVRDRQDGVDRWTQIRSYAVTEGDGSVSFVVNVFCDTTASVEQVKRLQEQATELEEQTAEAQSLAEELEQTADELTISLRELEATHERAEYLSRATAILASSLDYEHTLESVAALIVPKMADWCSVELVDPDKGTHQVAVAHINPEKVEWARELRAHAPPRLDTPYGLPNVLRTGNPELYPEISEELLRRSARDEKELALLRDLGFVSAMIVPLVAKETPLGAITLVTAESGKHFTQADLAFAVELGRRAGIAIERAELHQGVLIARDQAERALRESTSHAAWLSLLHDLTVSVSRATSHETIATIATEEARTAFGADFATLGFVEEEAIHFVAMTGFTQHFAGRYQNFPLDAEIPAARCIRMGEPILLADPGEILREFRQMQSVIEDAGIAALAVFPVRVGGVTIGSLSFSYTKPHDFRDEYVRAARVFAKEVGQTWDRVRALRQLEEARHVAELANQAKSVFLSTMSHELRTPINAILGFVELLEVGIGGPLSPTQTEYLVRVRASTSHLLDLINDVLDLSKIEAGQMEVASREAAASEVVDDVLTVMKSAADRSGLVLDAEIEDGIHYRGDPLRVRQILLNLMSNAVKFTPRGGRVVIGCADDGRTEAGRRVRFWVEDNGPGISETDLERIFEPFTQTGPVYTREHGGTGLGLTISRRLARMMGGDVQVESAPRKGARFSLVLPGAW